MAEETSFTQFKLRLPDGLKMRLQEAADDSGRSLTAEIIHLLERSLPDVEARMLENRRYELQFIQRERSALRERLARLKARQVTVTGDRDPTVAAQIVELTARLKRYGAMRDHLTHAIEELKHGNLPPPSPTFPPDNFPPDNHPSDGTQPESEDP